MNCKTHNGIKLCPGCKIEKPLSEFPIKWKRLQNGEKKPSYGRCLICTHQYDYARRRKQGKRVIIFKEKKVKTQLIATDKKLALQMKSHIYHRIKQSPLISITCKECNVVFQGPKNRIFCTDRCLNRHYRRINRHKERARMRTALVDKVDPYTVFDKHQWLCAHCGCDTPRHLRGTIEPNSPELDHIIPLSKGGKHSYDNVQLLCRSCNLIKSDSIIEYVPI